MNSLRVSAQEAPSVQEVFTRINQEVLAHAQGYETLKWVCEHIGHRLTGSENGARAETFVYDKWRAYGLETVSYQPFEVEAWSRVSCEVQARRSHPNARYDTIPYLKIQSVALAQTPVSADIKAPLIDAGNGLQDDYDSLMAIGPNYLKGRILLVNLGLHHAAPGTRNLHRSEKTQLAIQYGAAGVLFVYDREGDNVLTGTCSVDGNLVSIPVACISKAGGAQLRAWLKETLHIRGYSEVSVHLRMQNRVAPVRARNVIATIPGRELPREKIVIGGHLDSWDLSHCAIDNGIGAFSIVELARVYQVLGLRPRRTLEFVLFMGEEQGLLGSTHYVAQAKANGTLDQVRAMINVDMTGNPVGFNAVGRPELLELLADVGAYIHALDTGFTNTHSAHAGLHSDHQPFMLEGVPVFWANGKHHPGVTDCYHSNCDEIRLVDPVHMHNNVRFLGMMLYALADSPSLPMQRLEPHQVRDFLLQHKLDEALRIKGQWIWGD
ncbi:MAG: M28 family peptidase [Bacteroidetes bacterium]|nr:M28 family peptidase [Bacteroidota bacterium]